MNRHSVTKWKVGQKNEYRGDKARMAANSFLRNRGRAQVRMPHPLPKDYIADVLSRVSKKIAVEGNYSAQLAGIIREKTGILMDYFVLKWNGRPMSSDEVYEALLLIMKDKASKRHVLTHGS